jgi:hypothetical protein
VLHCQTGFAGNWTEGTISNTREVKQLLDYWYKLCHISSIIFGGVSELLNLRIQIAVNLAEEQIALVELLYNELAKMRICETYRELVDIFCQNFHDSGRVIETIKETRPSVNLPSLDSLKVEYLKARL